MPDLSADRFVPVSRADPCVVCKHGRWCRRSTTGAHECHRGEHSIGATIGGLVCVVVTQAGFGVYREPDEPPLRRRQAPARNNGHVKQHRDTRVFPTVEAAATEAARLAGGTVARIFRWSDDHHRVRIALPGGDKSFRPVTKCGDGWRLAGPATPYALFGASELPATGTVYVVEGEACVEAARSIGLVAVTSGSSSSAPSADWTPLRGRDVVILPDSDDAGRKYGCVVRDTLTGLAVSVRIVNLPGLPDAGDIVDFIEQRDSQTPEEIAAELAALVEAAALLNESSTTPIAGQGQGPILLRMADVTPEPVAWLWPNRIALGKLTLIAGDPGLGKSFITLDMAARISSGTSWPDSPLVPNPAGGIVLLSAEDDPADTIRPRLDAAGADVSRIAMLTAVRAPDPDTGGVRSVPFKLTTDVEQLDTAITRVAGCKLAIIDPVSAYLGGTDSHNNADIRGVLAPLAELAARRRVAIVAVTHLRKGDGPAMYRAMGSLAFVAAARAVWAVGRDRNDKTGRRRLIVPVKNNIARDRSGLAYRLEPRGETAVVMWDAEPVTISADDALETPQRPRGPEAEQRNDAADFLRQALAKGPRLATELIDEADDGHGITKRTLQRAKKDIGVEAFRPENPGPWFWRLSNNDADEASTVP